MKQGYFILIYFLIFVWGCKYTENIQDGETAFNLKKYSLAADLLEKEFNKEGMAETKAKLAYQIGQSYQFNNQNDAAANWYKTAIEWEYGSDAIFAYAKILKTQENYQEAIKQYQLYLQEEPYRRPEVTTEINACESAIQWIKNQNDKYEQDTYIINLKSLNSPNADFSLALSGKDKFAFTSSRATASGDLEDKWTGNKFYDLYESTKNGISSFSTPEPFNGPVNSIYNDGSITFSADFTEMFFTRCGSDDRKIDDYCNLYFSTLLPEGGWSEPLLIPFFEDSLNIGTACLSPDGQTLFFAAMGPDGLGGSDIYFSKRLFEGWDAPLNAGSVINTPGNEAFPTFGIDESFYFASDGHPGMGGLDIFSATYTKGKFSKITNMQYPINSGADDFAMLHTFISDNAKADTLSTGYFSSARKGGIGSDDIYLFVQTRKKLRPPVFILKGYVMQKVYEDSNDVTSGVTDTISLPNATASVGFADVNTLLSKFVLPKDSIFSLQVDSLKTYKVSGMKDGYFTSSAYVTVETNNAKPGDTVIIFTELILDKIPTSKETQIKLSNIYYDYNDTTLRAESFPELDKLVTLLNENPNLSIQINSHTDARGTEKYNQKLSQGRANSVVVYLIAKGIISERLVAKGFGESDPDIIKSEIKTPGGNTIPKNTRLTEAFINTYKSNKDDFEFLHQFNRRTTFNVLSDTFRLDSELPDAIEVDPAPDKNRVKEDAEKLD